MKISQIIAQLKNVKLVVLALVANFILVPIVALLITLIIPLNEPARIGLILLATAAGAPFLPKLAEAAKGSSAFSVGLMVLLMVGLVLNFKEMIALVGSLGLLAGVIFIVASLVIGHFLGGSEGGTRSVMGLGTAQRNISAALVVARQDFDLDKVRYLMVIAVIGLVVLMPAAGELGKRMKPASTAKGETVS